MVKSLTVDQAHIALNKLGKGYHMVYMYTHLKEPDIEGEGWYIMKGRDHHPLDVTKILEEDFIPGSDDLDRVHFATTINGNHIVYSNEMLSIEPPKGEQMAIFQPEGTRQFVRWLQDNRIGLS